MHLHTKISQMTRPSSVASLSFFCLLVLPAPFAGASSHASYKLGSSKFVFKTTAGKSSRNSQASKMPTATNCSSLATGLLGNNKLPVVHRQSPCSAWNGMASLRAADVLHRDASPIRCRFSSKYCTTLPANGSSVPTTLPGALDYSVLISYGTREQQFPVFLGTSSIGMSQVRCKPCASGSDYCNPAFDRSRSSTLTHVRSSFLEDVVTLTPSTAIHDFRFVCLDVDEPDDLPVVETLDLSRHSNSLPSQLLSSGQAPAASFSYCQLQSLSSLGFLSLGINSTIRDDKVTVHAPLVSSGDPELASRYFIDLVGISLGVEDILISAGTFGNNSTNLEVGTTFTMLTPDAYIPLRDSFRKQMSWYNRSSTWFDGFDTCFNFTRLHDLTIPVLWFKFSNGESLVIDEDQMLYYDDPTAAPFTMTCLAFSSLDIGGDVLSAVIGTYTLASMEVVYDLGGGTGGFIHGSC